MKLERGGVLLIPAPHTSPALSLDQLNLLLSAATLLGHI
jgi:hypothetical protein